MYLKINLNQQLINDLSGRIEKNESFVQSIEKTDVPQRSAQFVYEVLDHAEEIKFRVFLYFLSEGAAASYCTCGMDNDEICRHIEEAILFHQEQTEDDLQTFFGNDCFEAGKTF